MEKIKWTKQGEKGRAVWNSKVGQIREYKRPARGRERWFGRRHAWITEIRSNLYRLSATYQGQGLVRDGMKLLESLQGPACIYRIKGW